MKPHTYQPPKWRPALAHWGWLPPQFPVPHCPGVGGTCPCPQQAGSLPLAAPPGPALQAALASALSCRPTCGSRASPAAPPSAVGLNLTTHIISHSRLVSGLFSELQCSSKNTGPCLVLTKQCPNICVFGLVQCFLNKYACFSGTAHRPV